MLNQQVPLVPEFIGIPGGLFRCQDLAVQTGNLLGLLGDIRGNRGDVLVGKGLDIGNAVVNLVERIGQDRRPAQNRLSLCQAGRIHREGLPGVGQSLHGVTQRVAGQFIEIGLQLFQ